MEWLKQKPSKYQLQFIQIESLMMPNYCPSYPCSFPLYYFSCPPPQQNYAFNTQYFIFHNPATAHQQTIPSLASSPNSPAPQLPNQMDKLIKSERRVTVRRRDYNPKRQRVSAKKNSESNIINHYFHYFITQECSRHTLERLARSLNHHHDQVEKIASCLVAAIRLIHHKRGRMYMNKSSLFAFFTQQGLEANFPNFIENVNKLSMLRVLELSSLLRKSFLVFMGEISLQAILTSRRISSSSKAIHLQRRRKILHFLKRQDRMI